MDAVCCGAKCSFMAHSVIPRQRSKRSLSGGLCCKTLFWGVCVQISAKALVCSLENYVGGFSHKQSDFQLAAFSSSLHGIVSSNGPLLFLRRSEIWALHH
jgi:hypothetical protein